MSECIRLTIVGKPEPRGSKIAVPLYDKRRGADGRVVRVPRLDASGRVMTYLRDDNAASGPWMKKVARAAREAMGARPPVRCPVKLYLKFYLERPQYHCGTGRNAGIIKPQFVHSRPIVRPDRLKLARAIEDALTNVWYADDAQTVGGSVEKFYCQPGEEPRVEIEMLVAAVREPTETQRSLLDTVHSRKE